ncbi:MAG: sigma 54-interacting transcriptional regulator [Gammaproteobacteria bacterium]|nr:sigma 54-interacting transcriptional regulator [Gammaproteobacteria bacterium]
MARRCGVLEATLENMDQGVSLVDADLNVLVFNARFLELLDFPKDQFKPGFHMEQAFRYNAKRGEYGLGDEDELVRERIALAKRFEPHHFERVRPDGTVVEIRGKPLTEGGFVTTYTDITERKRMEEVIRASEKRYARILEALVEGIYEWRIESGGLYVSPRLKQIMEFERGEPTAEDWNERVHPEDFERYRMALIDYFKGGTHHLECKYRLRVKDGRYRWVLDRGMAVRDGEGRAVELVGAISDITTQVVSETALKESERKLATLMSNLPGVAYRCLNDQDWTMEFISEGCLDLTGRPASDFIGNRRLAWSSLIHPDDRQWVWEKTQAAVKARRPYQYELRFVTASGKTKWVWEQGRGVYAENGELIALEGFITDITHQKKVEQALKASEERYALASRAINEGIYDWNVETNEIYYSTRVKAVLGFEAEELRTVADWHARIHPDDLPAFKDAIRSHLKGETERFELDCRYRAKDGSWRWARQHGLGLRDERGRVYRMVGSTGDITELRERESALRQAHEELARQNERLRAEIEAHRQSRDTIDYLVGEMSARHRFDEIVGRSAAIKMLLDNVERVAGTDSTVLVLGETGTGKELVARAIHQRSQRADRPLITVNCASLPRDLVESELFGHEKGAFTGATRQRRGRFELADGGTIFLDEVGELPLETQAKLLRVLQEQQFERVGGSETLRCDVRVITATNRNLAEAVESGQFRTDLYYRLNVFPVTVPPLRARRDDIPLLARHFLEKAARRLGRRIDELSEAFVEAARHYDWPGNVRELENVIERAVILSPGPMLEVTQPLGPSATGAAGVSVATEEPAMTLEAVERRHILRVLEKTGWVVEGPRGAAGILGLNPSTLRGRLRKLGIRKPA